MIGEVFFCEPPEIFISTLRQCGISEVGGVRYEFFLHRHGTPVVYRPDTKQFWLISWPELIDLARTAGLAPNQLQ